MINKIVKKIVKTKDVEYIFKFACNKKGLTIENKDEMLKTMIELKNGETTPFYENALFDFSVNTKGLTKKDKNELAKVLIERGNVDYIFMFATEVQGLTKETKDALLKALIESKRLKFIAIYLLQERDINSINAIFGSVDNFIRFCLSNKKTNGRKFEFENIIRIEKEHLLEFFTVLAETAPAEFDYKYIDENVDKYLNKDSQFQKNKTNNKK